MRINIYSEEVTGETELVVKEVNGHTFYGARLFLASPEDLHDEPGDDDRNAITVWAEESVRGDIAHALARLALHLRRPEV